MKALSVLLVCGFLAGFMPGIVPAVSPLVTGYEDLHLAVTKDCGDGKTFTKLGASWKSFPVTYNISASAENGAAIKKAFATFEAQEHPAGTFFSEQDNSGRNIDVSFAPIDGASGVLARTSYTYNRATKAFVEVNIVFDSAENWANGADLSCSSQGPWIDVEAVAAHELGHGVGCGHSSSSTALTLYPYYSSGATHQRTLATGDAKCVDALY